MDTVAKSLSKLRATYTKLYSEVDYLHSGGCGIAAIAVLRLSKKLCLKADVILVDHNEDRDESNSISFLHSGCFAQVPSHVMILCCGTAIDGNGIQSLDEVRERYQYISIYDGDKSEQPLLNLISDLWGWNSSFKRKESIPVIEKITGIDLSDCK